MVFSAADAAKTALSSGTNLYSPTLSYIVELIRMQLNFAFTYVHIFCKMWLYLN